MARSLPIWLFALGVVVGGCGKSDTDDWILDGACREGCRVLAQGVCDPYGIAVQAGTVYWSSKLCGTIARVPANGGTAADLTGGTYFGYNDKIEDIAVEGSNLYATAPASGAIAVYPIAGGPPKTWGSDRKAYPRDIAIGEGYVFWTIADGIMRSSLSGTDITTFASKQAQPRGIAVHGGHVYWVNNGTGPSYWATSHDGSVMRAPLSSAPDSAIEVLVGGEDGPAQIAVDDTTVYWTNPIGNSVRKCPLAGGAAETIAAQQSGPMGIAVDARNVYWTIGIDETGNGGVMRASLATRKIDKLASDQNAPFRLATDGRDVFWTDPGGDPLLGGRVVAIRAP